MYSMDNMNYNGNNNIDSMIIEYINSINTIHLSQPPVYDHHISESNALYYRSNVDNKEYIVLIQSLSSNERVCKYNIQNDAYIPISPHHKHDDYLLPFKPIKLAKSIPNHQYKKMCFPANDQLLTMCTNKNQLAALNLNTSHYINNYNQANFAYTFEKDIKSLQFIKLKSIDFNNSTKNNGENEEETEEIKVYKLVYIESTETLIMFTNTENIYYYDLRDEGNDDSAAQWTRYEDVKLQKIP